jgi:hypothetical protein
MASQGGSGDSSLGDAADGGGGKPITARAPQRTAQVVRAYMCLCKAAFTCIDRQADLSVCAVTYDLIHQVLMFDSFPSLFITFDGNFTQRILLEAPLTRGVMREQLQNSTVADARHLLRTTMKDVDGKQEELRELVSVRYRDFIDAADTISAMGTSARTIIGERDRRHERERECKRELSESHK